MHFEDLDTPQRTAALKAVRDFMQKNDYVSLPEACQTLGIMPADLWEQIMTAAELPPCDVPVFAIFN